MLKTNLLPAIWQTVAWLLSDLLVLIYAGMGWDTQRSWHNQKNLF